MEALLNRYRNLTVLLVVILAQLLLLAYQVKTNEDVRLIRVWAVTAITPIAHILEVVRANTIGIAENYFVLIKVREENQRLSRDNGNLKLENNFLRTELQTADRVKALTAFQQRSPSRTLAARIIGNATGTNTRVVFVDRGSTAGVMKGMAVVTPDGIVGKVVASYPTASQVQLITDENFAAGVISDKHRVHGTLMGKGPNKPIVNYVQNEETVDQGEIFYTSGDDRVFPKGMPVGTATVVRPGKNFKDIFVSPTAFQNGLEEVLIVLEGVHQAIPDHKTEVAGEVKILPPPPGDQKVEANQDMKATLQTEADKLHDKYKKVGEAQNYKFGEGFRSPDFNANPNPVKPPVAAAVPGTNPAGTGQAPSAGTAAGTAAAKPPVSQPAIQPPAGTAAVKPPVPQPAAQPPAGQTQQVVKPPATSNTAVVPGSTAAPKPAPAKPQITEADTGARNRSATVPPMGPAKPKPPTRSKPDDGSPESLPIP